jgi:hypothetical protein
MALFLAVVHPGVPGGSSCSPPFAERIGDQPPGGPRQKALDGQAGQEHHPKLAHVSRLLVTRGQWDEGRRVALTLAPFSARPHVVGHACHSVGECPFGFVTHRLGMERIGSQKAQHVAAELLVDLADFGK